jgi:hypothetical protein
MNHSRIWKIGLCIFLLCFGILLYAVLLSIHQIGPISDAMINRATNAQTRQELLEDRNRRNREERADKAVVGVALAIDAILFLWVATSLLRRANFDQGGVSSG